MTTMTKPTRPGAAKLLGLLFLGLLLAFAVSACGSGSASSSGTTTPAASTTTTPATTTGTTGAAGSSASLTAFRNCLTQHGVTPPQGRPGGSGAAGAGGTPGAGGARANLTAAQQQALSACASLRPAGGFGGGQRPAGQGRTGGGSGTFAAFQTCLKQHGVQTSGAGGQSSSKTQSAIAACQAKLPNGGRGAAGSTTTTTTSG